MKICIKDKEFGFKAFRKFTCMWINIEISLELMMRTKYRELFFIAVRDEFERERSKGLVLVEGRREGCDVLKEEKKCFIYIWKNGILQEGVIKKRQ